MSEERRTIVVLGGGPAGIEAALAAATAGAEVILVSDGPVGGRAGWHSLLPSKVWLAAADTAGVAAGQEALGLRAEGDLKPDPAAILSRLRAIKEAWNEEQAAALADAGVTVIQGRANIGGPQTVTVSGDEEEEQELKAEKIIVAAGSVPLFPEGLKPNGRQILAPRFASHLSTVPDSVIVIGAGATGCEFAYLFNRLGSDVTWIVDQFGVLPAFVPEAGEFLKSVLAERGVKLVEGQVAERITTSEEEGATVFLADGSSYAAEIAFVAIGRRPDLEGLNLEAAGLVVPIGVVTDAYGRSDVPNIYVVGDAAGPPMVANGATAQAWVAGRHAAGVPVNPYRPQSTVAAIYTDPQVAQVGRMAGEGLSTIQVPFDATLKARLMTDGEGFLQVAYEEENGRLAGAAAAGPHAADVLAALAVALHFDATVSDLETIYPAHPTLAELPFVAVRRVANLAE